MKVAKYKAVIPALLLALMAGCGGGGGGSNVNLAPKSSLRLNVTLPRAANTLVTSATVEVLEFSGSSYVLRGSAYATLACTGETCSGSFFVEGLPSGSNYICKVNANYSSAARTAGRSAAQVYYYTAIGTIVDTLTLGVTTTAPINTTTTAKAITTIYYAYTNQKSLAQVTTAQKTAIYNAVTAELTNSTIALSDFVTINQSTSMDMFQISNWTQAFTDKLDTVLTTAGLLAPDTTDTTAPQVLSFSPAASATGVAYDGAAFSVIFDESMDNTVNLNNSTTLTASGFSVTIVRADDSSSLVINSGNALSYGAFSWTTTTLTNDTLIYTLNPNATLVSGGLSILTPGVTYNITSRTVPTNLKDVAGNPLNTTTNIPATGSFTTMSGPQVSSFLPANGATGVSYEQTVFSVKFTTGMDFTVNLNTPSILSASGFSITIQNASSGATLTINSSNALSYGTFQWASSTSSNDTLNYTLKASSLLASGGLKVLDPGTMYNITARTVPTNLKDAAGNSLDPVTNIPTTGYFTTSAGLL